MTVRAIPLALLLLVPFAACSDDDTPVAGTTSTTAPSTSTTVTEATSGANGEATTTTSVPVRDPATVFVPLTGYEYREVPAEEVAAIRSRFEKDPRADWSLEDLQLRSVWVAAEVHAVVMALSVEPTAALSEEFRASLLEGATGDAQRAPEEVQLAGAEVVSFRSIVGDETLVWQEGNLFVLFVGQDRARVEAVATGVISVLATVPAG